MKLENPGECECCGYPTKSLRYFNFKGQPGTDQLEHWYCNLCCSTMTSTIARYPQQYPKADPSTLKTICYVGNVILAAIMKKT